MGSGRDSLQAPAPAPAPVLRLMRVAPAPVPASVLGLMRAAPDAKPSEPHVVAAARMGHVKLMQTLLNSGCDVNAQSPAGWTALHWAAYNNDSGALALLLSPDWIGLDMNARTVRGWRGVRGTPQSVVEQCLSISVRRRGAH